MIELKQVTKQYGQATVLKNITLTVDEPGIYCLLGRNGAGKTTLLKSIAGYQNITSGTIQVDGKPITTSTLDTGVSYIENFAKHFNLPVRKLLRIASEVNPNYDYDFASEMMERFFLSDTMTVPTTATRMQRPRRNTQAHLPSMPGIETFMPKKPVMNVGNIRESDMIVRRFMMTFILLPMTDAKASIVPVRMSL